MWNEGGEWEECADGGSIDGAYDIFKYPESVQMTYSTDPDPYSDSDSD